MIPMNEYPASSVVPIFFSTYDSNDPSASVTLTGLAVTDIEIYKGTSMTQRASDAGYALLDTDGIDIDSITGIHGFSVDLGDNTDAGFYADGSFYTVVVSSVTVDGATINFIADRFRIVAAEDTAGIPKVNVEEVGGTTQTARDLGASVLVGDKTGFSLVSTGGDAILKSSTFALAIADAIWDEILTGGEHNVSTSAGRRLRTLQTGGAYEGGAIWVDTINGTAGTVDDENGTVGLPVDTWADALTLAASLGLKNFHIANASTVLLSAASENYFLYGHEWILQLNGQSIASTMVIDAEVSGTATGADAEFEDCIFGTTASVVASKHYNCSYTGTLTLSATGGYSFINCQSGVPGSGAPTFALGTGDITAEWRRWSGGINLTGIGLNDVLTISGELGTIDLGSATAGTVEIRGTYKALTNASSGVTVNTTGAILGGDVAAILVDTGTTIPATITTAQTDLDLLTGTDGVTLATAQGNYAPAVAGDAMALTSGERTTLAGVIWDSLTSGMVAVGSIGKKLADWTIATVSAIADQVWEEALADHSGTSGSTAEALAGATAPSAASIADAVWDEDVASSHNTVGSAGAVLDDLLTPSNFKATGFSTHSAANVVSLLNDLGTSDILGMTVEPEGSITFGQTLRTMLAILSGVTDNSGNAVFKTPDGAKTRAEVVVNASQERTSVTLTPDA